MSTSASASASASTSTNAPSNPPSHPPSSNNASSHLPSNSQSASPTLPHSPETARQIAEARAALEAYMSNIGSSLDHTLKSRARDLHSNSSALEKQQKELVKETEKMRKETDKLKKVADEGARRVKELGNVQNWAEMLERDFLVLGETMRLVRQGDRGSGWDGNEEGWETSSGSESFSDSESEDGDDHGKKEGRDGVAVSGERPSTVGDVEETDNMDEGNETLKLGMERQKTMDSEGDTAMDMGGDDIVQDAKKGKKVESQQQADADGGSSTTATINSSFTSTADPTSSSNHTAASTTS